MIACQNSRSRYEAQKNCDGLVPGNENHNPENSEDDADVDDGLQLFEC